MIRYGKSSKFLNKKFDFSANEQLCNEENKHLSEYKKSPKREFCINCKTPLKKIIFTRKEIKYFECNNCGHINAEYQITEEFNSYLYNNIEFVKDYLMHDDKQYIQRMEDIYLPKANFLIESILNDNINPNDLQFFDYGCGSGYFVYAMTQLGYTINGTDLSNEQVQLANKMLTSINQNTTNKVIPLVDNNIQKLQTNVLSMIGVLEHLENPNRFLEMIATKNIQYIYVLVPTFSLSDYIQLAFPDVYDRHLGVAHTHLYTENSLKKFFSTYGYEPISEWWFGGDAFDLFRNISTTLSDKNVDMKIFQQYYMNIIDEIQLSIDKKHACSEVHMLFKKIN